MFEPTGLKDKYGRTVNIGSILKVRLTFGDKDIVGTVNKNEDGQIVLEVGLNRYPLTDVHIYGEIYRA